MTPEERRKLIEKCVGIRVADWHDAMDALGLFDRGLMSPDIRPLWRDVETFKHCFTGFAFTVRVVPSNRAIVAHDPEDFRRQEGAWYAAQPKWRKELQRGDVIVIDARVSKDCGFVGSQNSMEWLSGGAVGIVTSGGVRDTDEVIRQRVPVYHREFSRGISPGRVDTESYQQPIECGGVHVRPGDLIVADGDGVMVIPAEKVQDALPIARRILEGDQKRRAELYGQLGIPSDATLGAAGRRGA
jgi:regulator of RNase E activity RraA